MSLMHILGLRPTPLPHGDMIIVWWPKLGKNQNNGQNGNDSMSPKRRPNLNLCPRPHRKLVSLFPKRHVGTASYFCYNWQYSCLCRPYYTFTMLDSLTMQIRFFIS